MCLVCEKELSEKIKRKDIFSILLHKNHLEIRVEKMVKSAIF